MSEIEINNRYIEYINRIFRWNAFQGRDSIERKNLSTELNEMRALANCFGNP